MVLIIFMCVRTCVGARLTLTSCHVYAFLNCCLEIKTSVLLLIYQSFDFSYVVWKQLRNGRGLIKIRSRIMFTAKYLLTYKDFTLVLGV